METGESELNKMLTQYYPENESEIEPIIENDIDILYSIPKKVVKSSKNHVALRKFKMSSYEGVGSSFWKNNYTQHPELFQIWNKLSSIQPTSASIERLFSSAKLVYDDLSARMDPETIFSKLVSKNYN